jgi:hypothetical protein
MVCFTPCSLAGVSRQPDSVRTSVVCSCTLDISIQYQHCPTRHDLHCRVPARRRRWRHRVPGCVAETARVSD